MRIPAKSPGFDREWQAHGHLDRAVELAARWARERPVEGLQVEVGPAARPHARPPDGDPRDCRRDGPALRSPRQAARDGRLERGPGTLDAGSARRPALRPRGGRRRLRGLRGPHRRGGAPGPGRAARPLRHPRRDVRGERQRRPARVHGRAHAPASGPRGSWCASTPRAATTTSSGRRPRCAAWSAASCRWRSWERASTRGRAGSCPRASGSSASSSRASRTSGPGRSARGTSTWRSRPSAPARRATSL